MCDELYEISEKHRIYDQARSEETNTNIHQLPRGEGFNAKHDP